MKTLDDLLEMTGVAPESDQGQAMGQLVAKLTSLGATPEEALRAVLSMWRGSQPPLVQIYRTTVNRCWALAHPGWQAAIKMGLVRVR